MKFFVRRKPRGTLVLSPKAQLVMGFDDHSLNLIKEFAGLRDEYLRRRDLERINRITAWEIEQLGLDAALKKAKKRA